MTTDIRTSCTVDAFSENDLLFLDRSVFPQDLGLSAVGWLATKVHSVESFPDVLAFVLTCVSEQLTDYDFWLLVGNSAWQPDTRVVRYRKLFNALSVRGINFEAVKERFEAMIERDGKLKFFGAVRLDGSMVPTASLTMKAGACTYIAALPRDRKRQFPLETGWSGNWNEDSCMVATIVGEGGILFRRVGYFDDPETGLVALMSPTVAERIVT